jgi:hypothetical protein
LTEELRLEKEIRGAMGLVWETGWERVEKFFTGFETDQDFIRPMDKHAAEKIDRLAQ